MRKYYTSERIDLDFGRIIQTLPLCWKISDKMSTESHYSSLLVALPACRVFLTELIPRSCVPLYVFMLQLGALFVLCVRRPTRQLPPLSKHLWAAAGLFCRTLRVQVAEPKSYTSACVSGEGEELMPPGCCHIKKDGPPPGSLGMQIEYPLVFAAAPPPHPTPPLHGHI